MIRVVHWLQHPTTLFSVDAIIAADQPFSPYFDASLVWGSVTGRMFYVGMRFRVK